MGRPRLVLIEWIDAYGCSSSWQDLSELEPKVLLVRSVGWLLHDNDDSKTIVPHFAEEPNHGVGDMHIPTISIKRIVDLVETSQLAPSIRGEGT